jgi:hypothetical protein
MGHNPQIVCRCGYEHANETFIEFRRDAVSNRVKLFCQKCGKRLFPEYITTSSREFREIFSGMVSESEGKRNA